jgi:hydroxymethylpyrimidine pyrophosphatase-like HAD family hydrolase
VSPNVQGVEVRPLGIDKGTGAEWLASSVGLPLHQMAGVGDSDPDLAFLTRVGLSAAPANATPAVKAGVSWVVTYEYGRGLLEILTRLEARNRARLTDT